MEYSYRFADISVMVTCPDDQAYKDHGVLAPFVMEPEDAAHKIDIQMTDHLGAPAGTCVYQDSSLSVYLDGNTQVRYQGTIARNLDGAAMRILRRGNRSSIQVMRQPNFNRITPKTILNCMEAEHLIANNRGFLLHASFIEYEGKAILFTAPSGTGKSTQADSWCNLRGATLVNGDRAAVQCTDGQILASGIPFSGSSGVCKNITLPLGTIVYLSQAPKTQIVRLKGLQAFRRIWEGCSVNTWNRQDVELCTQTVMDVLKFVPVFHLSCTPDESAVLALEQALKEMR